MLRKESSVHGPTRDPGIGHGLSQSFLRTSAGDRVLGTFCFWLGGSGQGILRYVLHPEEESFSWAPVSSGKDSCGQRRLSGSKNVDESRGEDGTHRGWGCTLPIAASWEGLGLPWT